MKTFRTVWLAGLCAAFAFITTVASAQRFGISAGAGMSFPIQEFADYYASGLTSHVTAEYRITGSISLTLSTGYTRWAIDEGVGKRLLEQDQLPGTLEVTGNIRNIPVAVGVRYYSLGSYGHSYLGLSTGTNIMKGTAEAFYDPQIGAPAVKTTVTEGWSSTGFSIEAGTAFTLADDWSVLVVLCYSSVLDLKHELIPAGQGVPISPDAPQARTLGFTVGIQYGGG